MAGWLEPGLECRGFIMNRAELQLRTLFLSSIIALLLPSGGPTYGGSFGADGQTVTFQGDLGSAAARGTANSDPKLRCRQRIARIVCLVDPIKNVFSPANNSSRPCLDRSQFYSEEFQNIYDLYPQALKKTMCSLDRIFVEKEFWASGYAHPRGRAVGILQKVLDQGTSLSEWSTWKERLPFALTSDLTQSPEDLPSIIAGAPGVAGRAAYFIITHELAHLIDLANNVSNIDAADFSRISWRGKGQHVTRDGLPGGWFWPCYYLCRRQKIHSLNIDDIYRDLTSSPFASLYATRNPSEDFAETLTYYVLSRHPDLLFKLKLGDKTVRDISALSSHEGLREKLAYVELLLKRPYLIHGFPAHLENPD